MVEFKVGDRVRVVRNTTNTITSNYGRKLRGQAGMIVSLGKQHCCLDIEGLAPGGIYYTEIILDGDPNDLCGGNE